MTGAQTVMYEISPIEHRQEKTPFLSSHGRSISDTVPARTRIVPARPSHVSTTVFRISIFLRENGTVHRVPFGFHTAARRRRLPKAPIPYRDRACHSYAVISFPLTARYRTAAGGVAEQMGDMQDREMPFRLTVALAICEVRYSKCVAFT
jgi:hypothetical protein